MNSEFKVIKKSAGYSVKSFKDELQARAFANTCSINNHSNDYIVCIYKEGILQEI